MRRITIASTAILLLMITSALVLNYSWNRFYRDASVGEPYLKIKNAVMRQASSVYIGQDEGGEYLKLKYGSWFLGKRIILHDNGPFLNMKSKSLKICGILYWGEGEYYNGETVRSNSWCEFKGENW